MEFVTWASWFSGHRFKLEAEILSSIFPWEVFQILDWKYLFCVQQEVFRVFIFPYFVLSWYILAQRLVKTFPKWKYFFSFSILKWHIIVQIIFERGAFLQIKLLWCLFFFQGCILLAKIIITYQSKQKTTN